MVEILDDKNERKFLVKKYPELLKIYEQYDEKFGNGCSGCIKKKFKNKILDKIKEYENQDKKEFRENLSENSIKEILNIIDQRNRQFKQKREKCNECIRKHLCTALILLTEKVEGYEHHKDHAQAELDQAFEEGMERKLNINDENLKKKILQSINMDERRSKIIGLLNLTEEFSTDEKTMNDIRNIRKNL